MSNIHYLDFDELVSTRISLIEMTPGAWRLESEDGEVYWFCDAREKNMVLKPDIFSSRHLSGDEDTMLEQCRALLVKEQVR